VRELMVININTFITLNTQKSQPNKILPYFHYKTFVMSEMKFSINSGYHNGNNYFFICLISIGK